MTTIGHIPLERERERERERAAVAVSLSIEILLRKRVVGRGRPGELGGYIRKELTIFRHVWNRNLYGHKKVAANFSTRETG